MAGDGSYSCPLADDLIFSSLQKPARPPSLLKLSSCWWRWSAHWRFFSGSSPALQLFCRFASLWYCFLSVKSHN